MPPSTSGARRYVVLLRAVNVGGMSVPMADLRVVLADHGFGEVATYIQSGNVIVSSNAEGPDDVGAGVIEAIDAGLGRQVSVIVLTPEELARVCRDDPFAGRTESGSRHVTFLEHQPDADVMTMLGATAGAPDEFVHAGRWIYVWCHAGYGVTGLSNRFFERALGTPATTRNWRTVTALARMAHE